MRWKGNENLGFGFLEALLPWALKPVFMSSGEFCPIIIYDKQKYWR